MNELHSNSNIAYIREAYILAETLSPDGKLDVKSEATSIEWGCADYAGIILGMISVQKH